MEKTFFQPESSGHTGLFIYCKESFQWTMGQTL